jgi:DNA-binding transcriptional MocR family regulator
MLPRLPGPVVLQNRSVSVVMSSWCPDLDGNQRGALHARIASALARDVKAGRLAFGDRLPTHRELARQLGVPVNIVTRAYTVAARDGIVVRRTGRGTFVQGFPEQAPNSAEPRNVIDLRRNGVNSDAFNNAFGRLLSKLSRRGSLHRLLEHQPHPGLDRHRIAGARWLARRGIDAKADQLIICSGSQEGLLAVFSAIARPGETILTERLTYVGIQHIVSTLHLNIRGIDIDEEGMIPDALAAACKRERVAAIFLTVTNHNPTNVSASVDRRKALVKIARRADTFLVEDDIFGHLSGNSAPTLAELAPERCVHVCGLSKCIAMALRAGYILTPPALMDRILDNLNALHWSSPALMAEIATQLIDEGEADRFVAWHRQEAHARQRIAGKALGFKTVPPCYHLWLPLPKPLQPTDFVGNLEQRGVLVAPSEQFAVGRKLAPPAIRISLGTVRDRALLQEGLTIIAESLQSNFG